MLRPQGRGGSAGSSLLCFHLQEAVGVEGRAVPPGTPLRNQATAHPPQPPLLQTSKKRSERKRHSVQRKRSRRAESLSSVLPSRAVGDHARPHFKGGGGGAGQGVRREFKPLPKIQSKSEGKPRESYCPSPHPLHHSEVSDSRRCRRRINQETGLLIPRSLELLGHPTESPGPPALILRNQRRPIPSKPFYGAETMGRGRTCARAQAQGRHAAILKPPCPQPDPTEEPN